MPTNWQEVIRANKVKLIAWISQDPSYLLDDLDSNAFIERSVYKLAAEITDSRRQSRFLVDHFIDNEEDCKNLLQSLKNVESSYPRELREWIDRLGNGNTFQQNILSNISDAEKMAKGLPSDHGYLPLNVTNTRGNKGKVDKIASSKILFHTTMKKLTLDKFYLHKISRNYVLKLIGCEEYPKSLEEISQHFLRNVMRANPRARNTEYGQYRMEEADTSDDENSSSSGSVATADLINPLDMITAAFLCADSFLQQELMQKMSQCQFALPLLLPDSGKGNITFMLWAMRQIVKNWKLQQNASSMEESLVSIKMPFISFIRIGECSVSKSKVLNSILSNEKHDFFVHREMACGDIARKCSDGLVETCTFCPGGKSNVDVFQTVFSILNLRGDARDHLVQLEFLKEISQAIFVVVDNEETDVDKILPLLADAKAQLFLITNQDVRSRIRNSNAITDLWSQLKLEKTNIIERGKHNEEYFTRKMRCKIADVIKSSINSRTMEDMAHFAKSLEITVDECENKCQRTKRKVKVIIDKIKEDGVKESKRDLPLQGDLWRRWSESKKEQNRLKKVGDSVEEYICRLVEAQREIRIEQAGKGFSDIMQMCVDLLLDKSTIMKMYALQWMKLELNSLSRTSFSSLRANYKQLLVDSTTKSADLHTIKELMSSNSLGMEHFMREIGQCYEATKAISKHKTSSTIKPPKPACPEALTLPAVAAELFLEGFPLELMDGDVGCIPIDWVTDVLKEVRTRLGRDPRVFVLTVLGVQSTGKSTLLNTMFGLQFAVSSGRCTRGAFMQLVSVDDELRRELACDFILVIDTEGLKAPQLATLHDDHEHDNELATVFVGLSDVTLINLATENAEDMKDVLQIVVHAFLRMKAVGKKPSCQFVHQNSGDVAASDKNMMENEHLIDQLNAMTVAAARMEHKESTYSKFTDVMEHDVSRDNWYIPGLWHGTPPMAAVSAAYSDQVFQLKQHLMDHFKKRAETQGASTLTEFSAWIGSIWEAVTKEHFIFSFRNSLVADAYYKLCVQYTDWEWEYRKEILSWTQEKENRIMNVKHEKLQEILQQLELELGNEISKGKVAIQNKLKIYFENKSNDVHLVEKYKEDFNISANHLCSKSHDETLNIFKQLVCRRQSRHSIDELETKRKKIIGLEVHSLLQRCKNEDIQLNEQQLKKEFDNMWTEVVKFLPEIKLTRHNVYRDVQKALIDSKIEYQLLVSEALRETSQDDKYRDKIVNECRQGPETPVKSAGRRNNPTQEDDSGVNQSKERSRWIITKMTRYIEDKIKHYDYCSAYCDELLQQVRAAFKEAENLNIMISKDLLIDTTVIVCHIAIKTWQDKHDINNEVNNPKNKLKQVEESYFVIFKELYRQGDENMEHAKTFCNECLKPSLLEAVDNKLGMDIAKNVKSDSGSPTFLSRKNLQLAMLLHLLDEDDFENYDRYITNYAGFTKEWIKAQVIKHCQSKHGSQSKMYHLSSAILSNLIKDVKKSVDIVTKQIATPTTLWKFSDSLGECLLNHIIINKDFIDIVGSLLFKNTNSVKQFSEELKSSLDSAEGEMLRGFSLDSDTKCGAWLSRLTVQPHIELYKSLAGCEKQCPFCGVPCDQGGGGHREHCSVLHYPLGLNGVRIITTQKLSVEVCTTAVASNRTYRCARSNARCIPYKEYRTINDYFASWLIQSDTSLEATTFWKIVFCKYNGKFAERHKALSADIPDAWKEIKTNKKKIMKDLKKTFSLAL
ncbi:interferon-induced very large GTPase 1-like [Lampetra fluviatilis]